MKLGIFKKHPDVPTPTRATEQSACFDVTYFPVPGSLKGFDSNNKPIDRPYGHNMSAILGPGDRLLIPTGLHLDIPVGYSVRVYSRSGNALKKGIFPINCVGIIDSDYVDELFVIMHNSTDVNVVINRGDRVGQIEMVRNLDSKIEVLSMVPTIKSDRKGGLGSTGE